MIPIIISPSSGVPIYRQLIEQIRRMVASKNLLGGDQLPSIRQLAVQLEVNPMTISKAYSMLEAEGLLERKRGIGMIVSNQQPEQLPVEQRISLLEPAISKLVSDAKQLDIDCELVIEEVRKSLRNK
ncbi:MAG: GntR family transcriptional regulator [Kangiellaceae bacterium]|nr:GntR family transcriptional regulator [Kangiellaceae bacterium]MCW8998746.1 GntR family transcriptional regulator [Kangiellaceae bacterium]